MWTAQYWRDLAERVVSTGAETLGGVLASATFQARDGLSWADLAVTVGVAMVIAACKCLAARSVGHPNDASLVK